MLDTNTEKSLNKLIIDDKIASTKNGCKDFYIYYKDIIDNCSEYLVKHNGNKHWLCGTKILTEWKNCSHRNPFESWIFSNEEMAIESFQDRNFNEDY